jgi:hypothetical protein
MSNTKRKQPWSILFVLVILIALPIAGFTVLAAPEDPQSAQGLFVAAGAQGSLDGGGDVTVVRTRFVDVDLDILEAAEVGDRIVLNLYDDAVFDAVLERKEATFSGGYAWIGHLWGQDLSQIILVAGDGQVAGNVSLPGAFYQVRYGGNGVHAIRQIDQSAFPPELQPLEPLASGEASAAAPEAPADACADIDVMVVWTPAARTAAGGTTAMENLVNLAVAETNQSYINSGLTQRIHLAHMEEVSYTESGDMYTDLVRLTNPGDGYMDNVHTLRDTHYADLVSLFSETGQACGIAWMMSSVSSTFENSAFSVVARTCATGYYSFGHEMGHNMGARHDWYVDDTLNAPYSYDKGYVNVPDAWRTIMAYNDECADKSTSCTRLPYWSNPSVLYGGDPMGVLIGTSTECVAGDLAHPACDANNRQTLNNTCSTVANFRDEPASVGPVVHDSHTVDDDNVGNSIGNGDGYVDCGETIELYVDLYNQGPDTAATVNATLSTTDPYVTFLFNTSSGYGDIAGGTTATNVDDFDFAVAPTTPHDHLISFELNASADNGGPWSSSFLLRVFCLSPDAYEPDNDSASATPIDDGVPQTHNIYPVGDEDWVTFTLEEESQVVLETSGPSGDSRMWLYDSALNVLEFDDDGGSGLWSHIDRVCGVDALPAGTYYAQIDEFGDYWPIAEYDISYTWVGACVPEIEVTPPSFTATLVINESLTQPLTISNTGLATLAFNVFDMETGAPGVALAAEPGAADLPEGITSNDAAAFPLERPEAGPTAPAPSEQPQVSVSPTPASDGADAFDQIPTDVIMAGSPVLVIQDSLPWGYDSIQQILTANGIPYDQINSSLIPTVNLSPYEMIVIPSVQGTTFYSTWNANIAKFEAYVDAGGKLWQSTCNYSATAVEPLTPGGVVSATDLNNYNNIVAPDHRWAAGVPSPIYGNYASHDSFTNLYPGSTVVAQAQTTGLPTLVDYRYGAGRVLLTGQTLEITWDAGWDGAPILENSLLDMYYTANPVLIIQDALPWGFDYIQQILASRGVTYYQVDSSLIATLDLSPYELVVVPSVQGEAFYNAWNANIAKIEAYVNAGGKLWQSTCNYDSTTVEPLTPGRVVSATDLETHNDIVALSHPWVVGVPNPMYGTLASHDSFTQLYAGSTVVARAQATGRPTLVDYTFGSGRVLITGQALEYAWYRGQPGAPILQNSLLDMLGLSDALWLTELPDTGTVDPGTSVAISVTFDATGLIPGTYTADIIIANDDPNENPTLVPVLLKVIPPPTRLYIEPSYAEIPEGGTFTVDVMVADVADLYGTALELTFDPAYVEVVDADLVAVGVQITPGTCPSPDFVVANIADNVAGTINYDVSALAPSPPCNGTGVIASITFRGKLQGPEFPLHFASWLLADTDGLTIPAGASDGTLIVVPPPSAILGNVYLQGRTDHSGAEVCIWDGYALVDCAFTDSAGYYEIPVAPGTYDVTAEMERYLDGERLGEVVGTGPYPLPDVTLLGGDANDDCEVSILDLSFMGARYGLIVGDPGWDDRADINADGMVNIQDIVLAGGNYLKTCPVPWP